MSDIVTRIASSAITALQAVQFDTDGKVTSSIGGSSGVMVDGIAQTTVASGEPVSVCVHGITRATAGSAFSAGTVRLLRVEATTSHLIPFSAGAGEYSVARLLPNVNHAAIADGDEIEVIFTGASEQD